MDYENIGYKCKVCGEEFNTLYEEGGAIEHHNAITEGNIKVLIHRFDSDDWESTKTISYIGKDTEDKEIKLAILRCVHKRLIPFDRQDIRDAIIKQIESIYYQ
jgi:hypothetical protein